MVIIKKEDTLLLVSAFIVTVIIGFIILQPFKEKNDVDLCRNIFKMLSEGNQSVQDYIDWDNLNLLGDDLRLSYGRLPDETQRSAFKRQFIRYFSIGFRQILNANLRILTNWRLYQKTGSKVIIAADHATEGKTLLLTISGGVTKKLVAIKWKDIKYIDD